MFSLNSDISNKLAAICRRYKVIRLHLFGSALREEFDQNHSDLDLVVEFSGDISVLDFAHNYFQFQFALEDLFNKEVDLICSSELKNPILIQEIEESKLELYAA